MHDDQVLSFGTNHLSSTRLNSILAGVQPLDIGCNPLLNRFQFLKKFIEKYLLNLLSPLPGNVPSRAMAQVSSMQPFSR